MTITRRTFMAAAGCSVLTYAAGATETPKRPNIIFLLSDDQRNDTLGCAGHPIIKTPVIDSLAADGVRFSNAFVTTSICAASRATLFTGLYERTHGFTFGTPPISNTYTVGSYPSLLLKTGYRTGFIGKFGVKIENKPQDDMFDYFKPLDRSPYFKKQPDGTMRHETELAGDSAIEFIDGNPKDKPFCLSISFNASHAEDADKDNQFPSPKSVEGMYQDVTIPPPRLSDQSIFDAQPAFLKESLNRIRYFWRWDTPEKYQKNMRAYFRMISGIDHVVGRIRQELEKQKLADNTVIIYMGDNGYYMGDRGFAGKWSHYEQSLRVPLIVYDPRLPQSLRGRVCSQMALNVDVPATLLEIAEVKKPDHYQGFSLFPLVSGKDVGEWRHDFFCEHLMEHKDIPKWEGVRAEQYVYARYFQQNPVYEFLHDLKKDPDQLKNLASDPDYQDILVKMRERCDNLKNTYQQKK